METMQRAYSLLTVKGYDDEKREITGIATTPTADRYGDVVDPKGAEFKLPIPLLWQHDAGKPIGHVTEAKVTAAGIEIKAKLARVDEAGTLRDRLDEAWQSIKSGLVGGLSIGFKPVEQAQIKDSYSYRFIKWLWLELSAVTIPANGEATITAVKSIDRNARAAPGQSREPVRLSALPGVTGETNTNPIARKEGNMETKTIQEQITAFNAAREAAVAKMGDIMQKAATEGRTLDAAEAEDHDTLSGEVKDIDKHLARLKDAESLMVQKARVIDRAPEGSAVEIKGSVHEIRHVAPKLAKGIAFARLAKCIALSGKMYRPADEIAKELYANDPRIAFHAKAAVSAANTISSTNAGFLVGDESDVFADFLEFLRPMTILGRFGQGGIPGLRQVPFRTRLLSQTSGGEGYWVAEGGAKPLTQFLGTATTLEPLKVANIAVATMELLRDSSPSAEAWLRDQLAAALAARLDIDFIDPAKVATPNVSPASILNTVVGIPSSGTDADAVRADIAALMTGFINGNNPPNTGVWIMPATVAMRLSLIRNAFGQREFPDISLAGGTLEGIPVITSEYIPTDSSGSIVALINARDIWFADDGGVQVDMSAEASLQMLDGSSAGAGAPTNNSVTPTATALVSMFQTNSVAFRAERTVNWLRNRDSGVQYLTGVAWAP